jgi:nicotinamide riboside kinase
MFSQYYHQTALPRLIDLANQCSARYDLFFLCDTDIPYAKTWDRSGDVKRKVFQKQIVGDLLVRKIPFFVLNGDLETRMLQAKAVLSKFRKYQSLSSLFQGGQ